MSESHDGPQHKLWVVRGHDTFAREDYYVGAFETREEAESCVAEKMTLHDHEYVGELADSFFITPPEGQGALYEIKRRPK